MFPRQAGLADDDDGRADGYSSEIFIACDTFAGPALVHGPQAEPDSPPLAPPTVAALETLVALAAADGIPITLEVPATRERELLADASLPSAWLWSQWGSGVGLSAWDSRC